MVEPGRVASGGVVQLVARVRNSAEEFDHFWTYFPEVDFEILRVQV